MMTTKLDTLRTSIHAAVQATADCKAITGESVKPVWSDTNQKELEPGPGI